MSNDLRDFQKFMKQDEAASQAFAIDDTEPLDRSSTQPPAIPKCI